MNVPVSTEYTVSMMNVSIPTLNTLDKCDTM